MGLLSKTLSLANGNNLNTTKISNKISFEQFIKKHNISLCAVFTKINSDYLITTSVGFDGISIISSLSSSDFWNGTIKEKSKWHSYTTSSEMMPFYQLFSFNQKDKINGIYIHFFEENIFMVCSSDDFSFIPNDVISNDLENLSLDKKEEKPALNIDLSKNQNVYKYELEINNALSYHIVKNLRKLEYKDIISKTIFTEIETLIRKSFAYPSLVSVSKNFTFKISLVSENEIPELLLKTHLQKELSYILDDESKLISLTNLGKSNSYKDVIDFLQAE